MEEQSQGRKLDVEIERLEKELKQKERIFFRALVATEPVGQKGGLCRGCDGRDVKHRPLAMFDLMGVSWISCLL